MDVSSYGWKEGIIKALKVIVWVAASGAVAGLAGELAKYEPSAKDLYTVAAIGIANAILAGLGKWLTMHKEK